MPTRIYTRSGTSPPVTPSSWTFATQLATTTSQAATLTKNDGSAMTSITPTLSVTNPHVDGVGRCVLGPLAAQTISGTLKAQMRGSENNIANNVTLALAVKLIQPNGTDRGILLAATASDALTAGNELTTSLTNMSFRDVNESASITLTSQTAQLGDYLVIEWGVRSAQTTASRTVTLSYGNNSATDLGENTTDTGTFNPWWEFSGTVTLASSVADLALTQSDNTESMDGTLPLLATLALPQDAPVLWAAQRGVNGVNLRFPFVNKRTLTIPGATHLLGTAALLIDVYDAATPAAQIRPDRVTVDTTSFDVVLTFAQPQTGYVVVGSAKASGALLSNRNFGFIATAGTPYTIAGTTHGYGTDALLIQVYDGATPARQLRPDRLTVHPTSYDIACTFAQNQTGIIVVSAGFNTGSTPNVTSALPGTTSHTIAGATHGLGTKNLIVEVYDNGTPRGLLTPGTLTVHPTSFDVAMTFRQNQAGTVVLNGSESAGPVGDAALAQSAEALVAASGVLVTGTVAATQGSHALVATSGVLVAATVAITQVAGSVSVGAGTITLAAAATPAQTAQGITAPAQLTLTGQAAVSSASQGSTATSAVALSGSAALTQAVQTIAAAALLPALATTLVTQDAQGSTVTAGVALVASSLRSQDGQVVSSASSLATGAVVALAQAAHVASSASTMALLGTSSATQAVQASASAGAVALLSALAVQQSSQSLSSQGASLVQASSSLVAAQQSLLSDSGVQVQATVGLAQAGETVQATEQPPPPVTDIFGATNIVQVAAQPLITGRLQIVGSLTRQADALSSSSTGVLPLSGQLSTPPSQGNNSVISVSALLLGAADALAQGSQSVLSSVVLVLPPLTGTLGVIQASATLLAASALPAVGTSTLIQIGASLTSASTLPTFGVLSRIQGAQAPSAGGTLPLLAVSPLLQGAQVSSFTAALDSPNVAYAFPAGLTATIPGTLHNLATTNLLVHVYDDQVPAVRITPDRLTIDPASFTITATFRQFQAGLIVISAGETLLAEHGHYRFTFTTPTQQIIIPAAAHHFESPALLVEVYDTQTPAVRLTPERVTVHPTSYEVRVTFAQNQTGIIVVAGYARAGTPHVTVPFGPTGLVQIPGTSHALGTRNLAVQVYDGATPRAQVTPGRVRVHPTTFDVEITFAQQQSGTVVLGGSEQPILPQAFLTQTPQALSSAAVTNRQATAALLQQAQTVSVTQVSETLNLGFPFGPTQTVTLTTAQHGLATQDVLVQVYDASAPARAMIPDSVTIAGNFDIVLTFLDLQSGTVVLSGGRTQQPARANVGIALAALAGTPFVIPATLHGLTTANLLAQVYDASVPARQILPESLTITPGTLDVTLLFLDAQTGTVVLTEAAGLAQLPNIAVPFTTPTQTVTIPAATHGLGTTNLIVQAWDNASPRRLLEPDQVTVHPTTLAVVVTFLDNQTGTIVLNGSTPTAILDVQAANNSLVAPASLAISSAALLAMAPVTITSASVLLVQAVTTLANATTQLTSTSQVLLTASSARMQVAHTLVSATVLPLQAIVARSQTSQSCASAGVLPLSGTVLSLHAAHALGSAGILPLAATATRLQAPHTSSSNAVTLTGGQALLLPSSQAVQSTASTGFAGAATVTADAQTSASSATLGIHSMAVVPSAAQIVGATAGVLISGSSALLQASDGETGTGVLPLQAGLARPQATNGLTVTSGLLVQSTLMRFQASESMASTAVTLSGGQALLLQDTHAAVAATALAVQSAVALSSASQMSNSTGQLAVQGASVMAQGAQTLAGAAALQAPASLALVQAGQGETATAVLALQGDVARTQNTHGVLATSTLTVQSSTVVSQSPNTVSGNAVTLSGGQVVRIQATQTALATAVLPLQGSSVCVSEAQTSISTGQVLVRGDTVVAAASNGLTATAGVGSLGALLRQQGAAQLSSTGALAGQGSALLTQQAQGMTASTALLIGAVHTPAPLTQFLVSTATVTLPTGAVVQFQAPHLVVATATLSLVATLSRSQAVQSSTGTGAVVLLGGATLLAAPVQHVISGLHGAFGDISATEASALLGSIGQSPLRATGMVSQADATVVSAASSATFAIVDALAEGQATAMVATTTLMGHASLVVRGDTVSSTTTVPPDEIAVVIGDEIHYKDDAGKTVRIVRRYSRRRLRRVSRV